MKSNMLLSDAILLGSMNKPQGGPGTGCRDCPATCAFGAALDADHLVEEVNEGWPWIIEMPGQCPACRICFNKLTFGVAPYAVIPHLNNYHKWTRERIAAFIKTIEPQEECTSTKVEEVPSLAKAT